MFLREYEIGLGTAQIPPNARPCRPVAGVNNQLVLTASIRVPACAAGASAAVPSRPGAVEPRLARGAESDVCPGLLDLWHVDAGARVGCLAVASGTSITSPTSANA